MEPIKTSKEIRYNHNAMAGIPYVVGDLAALTSVAQTVAHTFSDSVPPPSESLGLRRSFSIVSGPSQSIEGHAMLQTASKVTGVWWGVHDARLKIARGFFEFFSGVIGTATLLYILVSKGATALSPLMNTILNVTADVFGSIGLLMASISLFHNARLKGDLRRLLIESGSDETKIKEGLFAYFKKTPTGGFSQSELALIAKTIGMPIQSEEAAILAELAKPEQAKKLYNQEVWLALIGTVCLIAVIASIVGDFSTMGMFSKAATETIGIVLLFVRSAATLAFIPIDGDMMMEGLQTEDENSQTRWMKLAFNVVALGFAVGLLLLDTVSTGGLITLTITIIGILIANRKEIKEFANLIGRNIQLVFVKTPLPIKEEGKKSGPLTLESPQGGQFTEEETERLMATLPDPAHLAVGGDAFSLSTEEEKKSESPKESETPKEPEVGPVNTPQTESDTPVSTGTVSPPPKDEE